MRCATVRTTIVTADGAEYADAVRYLFGLERPAPDAAAPEPDDDRIRTRRDA